MQTNSTFRTILSAVAVLMLSNTVAAGVVAAKTLGCRDALKNSEGVDILFYSYEYDSKLSQHEDFFSKLYLTKKVHLIPSYSGGLDILQLAESSDKPEIGEIYGYETTFTNFTAAITGYYVAEETGQHTFEFFATTGGASLRVGADAESCSGFVEEDITDEFAIKTLGATEGSEIELFTTYLEKDVVYPVEIIVHNWKDDVFIVPSVIVPGGDNYILEGFMFTLIKKTYRPRTVDAARA